MKYEVAKREITTTGTDAIKIQLQTGSKAFKILFASIYKDIVKALVRELFTNAWDSQKKHGTLDIPIEIHAPNKFEPYFSIRDYGTGMTFDVVKDIYSVVFRSTKDTSNDEAGFMGMGSKSPLGYTDIFSLVSYVDGKYYAYEIYIDEDSDPVINPQGSGDTTEPNGVFISLPVEDDDIEHFTRMINDFVVMSDANVKIDGKKISNTVDKLFKSTDGHYIYKSDNIKGVYFKMGCVLYPFDKNTQYINFLHPDYNIVLDFPIGSFEVTGSRDDIIYNKGVAEVIKEAYTKFAREYFTFFSEKLKNCKTYVEACEYVEDNGAFAKLCSSTVGGAFKWKSRKISFYNNTKTVREICRKKYEIVKIKYDYWYGRKFKFSYKDVTLPIKKIRNSSRYILFFDDGSQKNYRYKIERYINENISSKNDHTYLYVKGETRKSLSFLFMTYKLGITDIVDISLLADYKRPKPEKVNKHTFRRTTKAISASHTTISLDDIKNENKKYYYINKKDDVQVAKNAILYFDIDHGDVLYIYKKDEKHLEKHPDKFIDLISKYKEEIEKLSLSDNEILSFIYHHTLDAHQRAYMKLLYDNSIFEADDKSHLSDLFNDTIKQKIDEKKLEVNKIIDDLSSKQSIIIENAYGLILRIPEFREELIKLFKKTGDIE